MSALSRTCIWLVQAAAWIPVPALADRKLVPLAISTIALYRRHLSSRTNRICLFHPSCSYRAEGFIREHGFFKGMRNTLDQLRRCGGAYSILKTANGDAWLRTEDGCEFGPDEISIPR